MDDGRQHEQPGLSTLLVGAEDALAEVAAKLARRGHGVTRAAAPGRVDLVVLAEPDPTLAAARCRELRARFPHAALALAGPPLDDLALDAILDAGADAHLPTTLGHAPLDNQLAVLDRAARARAAASRERAEADAFRALAHLNGDYCARLRVVPDHLPVFEYATGDFTGVTGYTLEEFARLDLRRLLHAADEATASGWFQHILEGKPSTAEYRVVDKLGETRWVHCAGAPIYGPSGEVEGVLATVSDVSKRVHAQEALRDEAAALRAIIDHAPVAIVTADYAGMITRWNPAAERLFGWKAGEVVGKPNPLLPPDELSTFQLLIENAFCGDLVPYIEGDRLRSDGTRVNVTVLRAVLRDADGAPTGLVGMMTDNTERKQLEAELRVTDRLAAVGRLAASVGHEVNNPLAYVLTNIDLVLDELGEGAEPEIAARRQAELPVRAPVLIEQLREAREGAERVRHIVRDLKVFSQPDGEERAPVDPRRVLDSSANMAAAEIRHRARLVKRYQPTAPVLANEARLGQVLLNLLINAAHAVTENAVDKNEIAVATFTGPDGRVVIEVRDSGVGIPNEVKGRIFEPFFTTKTGGRGTGLGLSICKRIVDDLGGEITVDSVVGQGTCFRVHLPPAPAAAAAPPKSTRTGEIKPFEPRKRLLVVDDELPIARAIARLFRDHEVVVAGSGRAALEAIREKPTFDAILCDLMMPDLTGMDVYETVRDECPGLEKKIAFMTGGVFTPRASTFLASIPNPRLEKPFESAAVMNLVGDLTRKRR